MPTKLATRTDVDTAGGGIIRSSGQTFVHILGPGDSMGDHYLAVEDDPVDSHGSGGHASATMNEGQSFITIKPLAGPQKNPCRAEHLATCGHQATGSGVLSITYL
jgi:hypothetical protein